MSETIYLLTICLPLATILIVFGMKYFSAMRQARARYENDEAYRELAAKTAAAQAETATALAGINTTLADLKSRVMAVEKVLKEVE
jgi:Tfp pilus assembly protein PilO